MRGKIITIEGGDGSGKETQSKILCQKLNDHGIPAITVSFPMYSLSSSAPARSFLNGDLNDLEDMSPEDIALLFAFDRSTAWKKLHLTDKLNDGTNVICDRFTESNIIYQAARAKNLTDRINTMHNIRVLENTILKIPRSDVVVYLRTDWEVSKKLIDERGEKKDINETQEDYMELVSNFGSEIALRNNWSVINCCPDGQTMLSKDVISNAVLGFVLPHVS